MWSREAERDKQATLLGMSQQEVAAYREQAAAAEQAKWGAISEGVGALGNVLGGLGGGGGGCATGNCGPGGGGGGLQSGGMMDSSQYRGSYAGHQTGGGVAIAGPGTTGNPAGFFDRLINPNM